jgi:asparaginyl-tRNA synthetase
MEFWMVEPEVAFLEFEGLLRLTEEFVCYLAARVLERCREELEVLERDVSKLECVTPHFPQITYTEAIEILQKEGCEISWGDDFGGDDETVLAQQFDKPVFVTRFPKDMKAFYMQPDPEDPGKALCLDVLAPEGYGEIIGGSQRIHDFDLLQRRIREHDLPEEAFRWYLDIRRYGTVPHAGFGLGFERAILYATGVENIREVIPFPRAPRQAEF